LLIRHSKHSAILSKIHFYRLLFRILIIIRFKWFLGIRVNFLRVNFVALNLGLRQITGIM